MIRLPLAIGASTLLAACGQGGDEPVTPAPLDEAAITARSAPVAQEFQQQLKAQLVEALQNGGPMAAVSVCKEAAPAIAAAMSADSGAQVSRIATKHRNPAGAVPDAMRGEYDALAAQPVIDGAPAARIWRSGEGEGAQIHYLSAIPMQEQPCSVCHGTNIDPALKAHIDGLYPGDLATGFVPGEMRGALLISWPEEMSEKYKNMGQKLYLPEDQ